MGLSKSNVFAASEDAFQLLTIIKKYVWLYGSEAGPKFWQCFGTSIYTLRSLQITKININFVYISVHCSVIFNHIISGNFCKTAVKKKVTVI